jgi:MFS family permease
MLILLKMRNLEVYMNSSTKGYKISVVALLTGATMINAIDRGAIGVAAPLIMQELQLDPAMMGVIFSVFFWTYTVLMIPVSGLADKMGAKKVLGWAVAVWSLASAVTGLASSLITLAIARMFVGVGETAMSPVASKVIGQNFISSARGKVISIVWSGTRLGLAATPVLMAYLMSAWNWRIAFIVTGIGSLLWCIAWYFFYKTPESIIVAETTKKKIPWKALLTNRTTLGFVIANFFQGWMMWFYLTWVPSYLVMERGFSIIKMGIYASIPWIVAIFAQNFMGWLSDRMIKKGIAITLARKYAIIFCHLVGASAIGVGFVDDPMMAVLCLTISMAGEASAGSLIWVLIAEAAPPQFETSLGGIVNASGALAGILSPIITGVLISATGSFQLALVIGGFMLLIAAATIWWVIPDLKPMTLDTDVSNCVQSKSV